MSERHAYIRAVMTLNYSAYVFKGKICSLFICKVITESKRKSCEIQVSTPSAPPSPYPFITPGTHINLHQIPTLPKTYTYIELSKRTHKISK